MSLRKVLSLACFLLLCAAAAIADAFVPSLEITGFVDPPGDNCTSGSALGDLTDYVNIPGPDGSDDLVVTAPGDVTVADWTFANSTGGENYHSVGANTYGIGDSGQTVAAGTPLTATIRTYFGLDGTGGLAYTSSITWNCTTGAVLSIVSGPASSIPALGPTALALLALALAGAGAFAVSRLS